MSLTVIVASILLSLVGIMFGCMPFVSAFRALPRWIRVALHTVGAAFVGAAVLYTVLDAAGSRISIPLHRLIFGHILVIIGMGLGILFLLAVSGEYMKALRNLSQSQERDHHHV